MKRQDSRFRMLLLATISLVFSTALCSQPLPAEQLEDSISFTVRLDKHEFLKCEPLWGFLVLHNTSHRDLSVVFPSFQMGFVEADLRESNGKSIPLRTGAHIERHPDYYLRNSAVVGAGDSLVGLVNLNHESGAVIGVYGSTFCHANGRYAARFRYLPADLVSEVTFTVVEPEGAAVIEFTELDRLNRLLWTPEHAATESRISEFFSKYPRSVYLPEVYQLKVVLYKFTNARNTQRMIEASKAIISEFPNHPIANKALYNLFPVQTWPENERMLQQLSAQSGTLISVLAKQKLQDGGVEHMSREEMLD